MRRLRHFVYGASEGEFISLGGLCEAAEFSDKLQRRRADFLVRRWRFEIVQSLDVSTHNILFQLTQSYAIQVVS